MNSTANETNGMGKAENNSEIDSLKSIYKRCIDTRNFEINQLIQRNNFFMLFQGVLLAAALQNQTSKPIVEFIICLAGFLVSVYQLQMACGAKFWQEWWESRVNYYEGALKEKIPGTFHDLFAVSNKDVFNEVSGRLSDKQSLSVTNFLILRAFSVSRAPIKVSLILILAWLLLTLHCINFSIFENIPAIIKGFSFTTQK